MIVNLSKVRSWAQSLRTPSAKVRDATLEEFSAGWKEDAVETIAGCLLDGKLFGFHAADLLIEGHDLFRRVLLGRAELDMANLERRGERDLRPLIPKSELETTDQARLIVLASEWRAELRDGLTQEPFFGWLPARLERQDCEFDEYAEEDELERSR